MSSRSKDKEKTTHRHRFKKTLLLLFAVPLLLILIFATHSLIRSHIGTAVDSMQANKTSSEQAAKQNGKYHMIIEKTEYPNLYRIRAYVDNVEKKDIALSKLDCTMSIMPDHNESGVTAFSVSDGKVEKIQIRTKLKGFPEETTVTGAGLALTVKLALKKNSLINARGAFIHTTSNLKGSYISDFFPFDCDFELGKEKTL